MSKSIVKKALESLDDDEREKKISLKKKKVPAILKKEPSKIQDRKQLARTCLTLKRLSAPVVTSDQVEQLNNYRFGGPSKRDLQLTKKKEKEDEQGIFTEEDFQRFAREYNPPLRKS